MNRSTLWASLVLTLALVTSIVLTIFIFKKPQVATNTVPKTNSYNAFMTNSISFQYDSKGQLQRRIITKKMVHYPNNDTIYFSHPKILMYTTNHIPWYITAESGSSEQNNKIVHLYHHVRLYQPPQPDHPETTVTTSALTIYPNKSFAHTNEPVTIIRPGTIVKGTGVNADLKKGIFNLLTHSRGVYASEQLEHNTQKPTAQQKTSTKTT